jgi:uncharacterized repeat protein (TIGR03803 family)
MFSFGNGAEGAGPWGALVEANDGNFYGNTASGGSHAGWTVFRISRSGVFASLYSFTNGVDGRRPVAGLIQANDGYLYGTATVGGSNYVGTVFRISTNGALKPLYSFTGMKCSGGRTWPATPGWCR